MITDSITTSFESLSLVPQKDKESLSKHSFERVKEITKNFIKNLSEPTPLSWSSLSSSCLISTQERTQLTQIFKKRQGEISSKKSLQEPFKKIGQGSHHGVWVHPDYPQLVYKIMDKQSADQQVKVAEKTLEFTKGFERSWIQIPRATSIDLGTVSIYVEERLPLVCNPDEHQEFWARVILHYQSAASPLFKENLKELVGQIKALIEEVGFWDIGDKNLPEVRADGAGVCATDFENVQMETKTNVGEGIRRLACMFPVTPLVEDVIGAYKKTVPALYKYRLEEHVSLCEFNRKYNLPLPSSPLEEDIMSEFQLQLKDHQAKLSTLQLALQSYDQQEMVTGDESIPDLQPLSDLSEEEMKLAEQFFQKIQQVILENKSCRTLTQKRYISLKPISCSKVLDQSIFTYERFTHVLCALQKQGIVRSWTDNHDHPTVKKFSDWLIFEIYF